MLHVAFGGGPHLLLAACTRDTLAVVSLEGLAAHLFQQQTGGGGGGGGGGSSSSSCGTAGGQQQALWHQLASAHCGAADVLAMRCGGRGQGDATDSAVVHFLHKRGLPLRVTCCRYCLFACMRLCGRREEPLRAAPSRPCSWTQQLDGILTSSSDGLLTMWELRPLALPSQPEAAPLLLPGGSAAQLAAAALRAAWSARAPIPQRLVCAGVSVYAPSATAAGQAPPPSSGGAADGSCGTPRRQLPGGSPLKPAGDRGSVGSGSSSPARDCGEAERYASVWWPQHREQRQRHYAGGKPSVGQEKLRHPSPVTGACLRLA